MHGGHMITNTNYVELSGRLTKDITLKVSRDNEEYGVISIAVNKFHTDSQGYLKYQTAYFDVFIWRQMLLDLYKEVLKKGVRVIVRAELVHFEGKVAINVIKQNGISILQDLKLKNEKANKQSIVQGLRQDYENMSMSKTKLKNLQN
jgi:hypothetical protein